MAIGIKSLSEFIGRVGRLDEGINEDLFFRGHGRLSHFIEPGVARTRSRRENEREFLYSLISEHPTEFDGDEYTFDKLVRAQHYEVPTRLLDLTSNALIGLYFACCTDPDQDGRVLIFQAPKLSTKYFMSDCVSCAANLSRLSPKEKHQIELAVERVKRRFVDDETSLITFSEADASEYRNYLQVLNDEPSLHKLLQLIREEKPHFEAIIDPTDLLRPYVVFPKKSNARIVAQSGAFVLFGLPLRYGKISIDGLQVKSFKIDGASKQRILLQLDKVGIHEGTVFPEMDKTAHRITKKLS